MRNTCHQSNIPKQDATTIFGLIDSGFCSMDYKPEAKESPWGIRYFGSVKLGNVEVFKHEGTSLFKFARTRKHILNDLKGDLVIALPLRGGTFLVQAGKRSSLEPGSYRVVSTSMPFFGSCGLELRTQYSVILVRIPGAMLRQELPNIDDLCNLSFRIRPGAGNIMKSLIELSLEEGKSLSLQQAEYLGKSVIHSASTALLETSELDSHRIKVPITSHDRIFESAKNFILNNLANPMLDSTLVAAHCGVSERYLRVVFNSASIKLCAYIRETRLDQCRASLRNPGLRHRSVIEIAMSWGFVDPPYFSRIYKERFGKTPREDRCQSYS